MGSAQNTLGNYHRYSPPPYANPEKALAAYERASEAGEPWAMIPLAEMLFYGEGGKRDSKRALELVERAEKAGLVGPSQNALGDYYRSTGAFEKAASAYERALDTGERGAMLSLAKLLFKGQGIKRDEKRAMKLIERAEKAGWDQLKTPWETIIAAFADISARLQSMRPHSSQARFGRLFPWPKCFTAAEAAALKWDGADLWYQTMILSPSTAQK